MGMLYVDGFFGLVMLGLWIFCIVEVITTPEADCRNLPKLLWLLIVVVLPTVGSLAWLIAGRPAPGRQAAGGGQYAGAESRGFPEMNGSAAPCRTTRKATPNFCGNVGNVRRNSAAGTAGSGTIRTDRVLTRWCRRRTAVGPRPPTPRKRFPPQPFR